MVNMKRLLSLILVLSFFLANIPLTTYADGKTSWWDKVKDVATDVASGAADVAGKAKDVATDVTSGAVDVAGKAKDSATSVFNSAKQAVSRISLPDFKKGWDKAASFFGTNIAALGGQQYVSAVASAIDDLQATVSSRVQNYQGGTLASKAGFAAEEWHAGTFNIDAIARGSKKAASTGSSNALGSADVSIGAETNAGLKYYATAEKSAKAQARITQDAQGLMRKYSEYVSASEDNIPFDEWLSKTKINLDECPDLFWELYQEQVRIIPSDQIEDAKVFLKKAIAKESAKEGSNRKAVEISYRDTLENLSDRLEASDGTSSVPLSKQDAEAIAKAASDNDFKPSDFGIKTTTAIKGSYIAKQAMKAGATAAIIQTALTVGPEIYEILKALIATGEIDKEQLKQTGLTGLSAAADGYLKGSISNALVIMCKAGKLGPSYISASPELIGAMTVMIIDAIRYGIKMAKGEMSTADYADIMAQELLVSAGALGAASLVSLLFPSATLAVCLGSFVGGLVVSAGYSAGKEFVLAKIDEAGVDLLVPIQNTSSAIKDKAVIVTEKVTDALSGMKGIDISSIKDKTIKVFDFTV